MVAWDGGAFAGTIGSKLPVDDAVGPFFPVGGCHFYIIIGITLHHWGFDMSFQQQLAGLTGVPACEVLHFAIGEVAQDFVPFLADGDGYDWFQLEGFGVVAFGVGENVKVRDI